MLFESGSQRIKLALKLGVALLVRIAFVVTRAEVRPRPIQTRRQFLACAQAFLAAT
jgi:hypothetical protein